MGRIIIDKVENLAEANPDGTYGEPIYITLLNSSYVEFFGFRGITVDVQATIVEDNPLLPSGDNDGSN